MRRRGGRRRELRRREGGGEEGLRRRAEWRGSLYRTGDSGKILDLRARPTTSLSPSRARTNEDGQLSERVEPAEDVLPLACEGLRASVGLSEDGSRRRMWGLPMKHPCHLQNVAGGDGLQGVVPRRGALGSRIEWAALRAAWCSMVLWERGLEIDPMRYMPSPGPITHLGQRIALLASCLRWRLEHVCLRPLYPDLTVVRLEKGVTRRNARLGKQSCRFYPLPEDRRRRC